MRIIVGAGHTKQDGWTSLEHSDLDITRPDQWARLFPLASLDAILAEHVFEHLTLEQGKAAAWNCYRYLRQGGYLRVAVPDGLHPESNYLNWVAPHSAGERFLQTFRAPQDQGHQVLFNYRSLSRLLNSVGFYVRPLEWFDERQQFHRNEWSQADGAIMRCGGALHSMFLSVIVGAPYTSLIVDAEKR